MPGRPDQLISPEQSRVRSVSLARLARDRSSLTAPRASGLPNLLVLLLFPAVMTLAFVVLVLLGVSGSSGGAYWAFFGSGADPDLIAGVPRNIRSDEWLVQSSWIVSQVQQGFPAVNGTFPGGMDATIQNDLPSWEWSTLFRPHVLGFLLLPLDMGMAVRWWLPALGVVVSVYWFVVTLLPRHPLAAAAFAFGLLLSPILQWWFLPTTLWPVAFGFAAMTAVLWGMRSTRLWPRMLSAAASGYLAVTMAMSIYVPFIVPAVLVTIFFALGVVLFEWRSLGRPLKRVLGGLLPLVGAAVAAGGVLGAWVVTRLDTVEAVTSTVYPGERLELTGQLNTLDGLVSLFSGPFQRSLMAGITDPVGPNQSEAATPLMLVIFLVLPMIWAAFARPVRSTEGVDWMLLAVLAVIVVLTAFLLLPSWDAVAHAAFLDRTTVGRARLAFAILGVVAAVLVLRRGESIGRRIPWWITLISAAAAILATVAVSSRLRQVGSLIPVTSIAWIVCTGAIVLAVVFAARIRPLLSAGALLAATGMIGWGVNPLYDGVFDLRETEAGRDVAAVAAADPGADWVGIGGFVPTAVLVESGVSALNGVQTYPPEEMWAMIDPDGSDEGSWNRLANVNWVAGSGEPVVTIPVRDQILVTFDSCSVFAQQHIEYVLSESVIDQSCVREVESAGEGESTLRIYEVIG